MDQFGKILVLISLVALSFSSQNSLAAPSLTVSTSKQVYEYGDFLSVNLQVSELTGDQIVFHIIDSTGQTSSPIPIQISKLNSTIIAPVPFYKTNYSPGTYQIVAEYSGAKTSITFQLTDSGKIAIPTQYKILVKSWLHGTYKQDDFAALIRELINFNIINVPNYQVLHNSVYVPHWLENNAKWWSDNSISDNEFGSALQYLLEKGFISV